MTEVVVGHIVRPHGVRGEVVVEVRTDEPHERFYPEATYATDQGDLVAEKVRWHQGRPMLTLRGITDRTAAEGLRRVELRVDISDEEPDLGDDEFRDIDLVGLTVVDHGPDNEDSAGAEVGTVLRIDHGPAHDLLVVKRRGQHPALIPFVAEMVDEIDLEAETVRVTLPPGLLEL